MFKDVVTELFTGFFKILGIALVIVIVVVVGVSWAIFTDETPKQVNEYISTTPLIPLVEIKLDAQTGIPDTTYKYIIVRCKQTYLNGIENTDIGN